MQARRVVVTGGSGHLGRKLVPYLAEAAESIDTIVSMDIHDLRGSEKHPGVAYEHGDVRDPKLAERFAARGITTVVHLATIVDPGPNMSREQAYSVDVEGTRNVLDACLEAGVEHFVVTSSGAAYGYWPDNPAWIDEHTPLRGNEEFAYSDHKRQVEEMLAHYRSTHPELAQLVLRPGTVLGRGIRNQITNLFTKPVVLGVAGSETPFVFIWDEDVAEIVRRGVVERKQGIYNLAGDGAVPLRDIARRLKKPYLPVPAGAIRGALGVLKPLGLTRYGPEQVNFLRYRPVLSNRRLAEEFGYAPAKSSRQALEAFLEDAGLA